MRSSSKRIQLVPTGATGFVLKSYLNILFLKKVFIVQDR